MNLIGGILLVAGGWLLTGAGAYAMGKDEPMRTATEDKFLLYGGLAAGIVGVLLVGLRP